MVQGPGPAIFQCDAPQGVRLLSQAGRRADRLLAGVPLAVKSRTLGVLIFELRLEPLQRLQALIPCGSGGPSLAPWPSGHRGLL
jgi:hypothetical protein